MKKNAEADFSKYGGNNGHYENNDPPSVTRSNRESEQKEACSPNKTNQIDSPEV